MSTLREKCISDFKELMSKESDKFARKTIENIMNSTLALIDLEEKKDSNFAKPTSNIVPQDKKSNDMDLD